MEIQERRLPFAPLSVSSALSRVLGSAARKRQHASCSNVTEDRVAKAVSEEHTACHCLIFQVLNSLGFASGPLVSLLSPFALLRIASVHFPSGRFVSGPFISGPFVSPTPGSLHALRTVSVRFRAGREQPEL